MLKLYSTSITILITSNESISKSKRFVSAFITEVGKPIRLEIISIIFSIILISLEDLLWSNYTLLNQFFQVNIEILLTFVQIFYIIQNGGEKMKLSELKHHNYLKVYNSIVRGNDTHFKILKDTGISRYTISEITNNLVERNILEVTIPKRDEVGRRINKYKASNNYFCVFIDKQEKFFSTIGITTSGSANIRFDYRVDHNGLSAQEVFDKFVMNQIKKDEIFKYCMAIYLINGDDLKTNNEVIKTTKESLIIESLTNTDKMILFEFNGRCVMSLYGRIHHTDTDKYTLSNDLEFDEIITLQGDLYYESFNALQIIATKNIEKII